MGEGHITDAQVVEEAESGQATVNGVTALHPDHTTDTIVLEGFLYL